jgi:hypothetical protein
MGRVEKIEGLDGRVTGEYADAAEDAAEAGEEAQTAACPDHWLL